MMIQKSGTQNQQLKPPWSADEHVLDWIQQYIAKHGLKPGDSLPKEIEIAKAANTGRSSVREALTALKILGIIVTRRKGGIRIIRDPVLLELRHYFSERYASMKRLNAAMEFRSAMERGFSEVIFAHIRKPAVSALQKVLNRITESPVQTVDLHAAETEFHTLLLNASGNELAGLFSHIYGPVFGSVEQPKWTAADVRLWLSQHKCIVDAIERRDRNSFIKSIGIHTRSYMRY